LTSGSIQALQGFEQTIDATVTAAAEIGQYRIGAQ
jgi:hypothetical protein